MRLWANNVRFRLDPVYVPFQERATSARLAVLDALERLKASGRAVVSNIEIVREVQSLSPEWSYEAISKAVQRELGQPGPSLDGPHLMRHSLGTYVIS